MQDVRLQHIELRFKAVVRSCCPTGSQVKVNLDLDCVRSDKSDTRSNRLEINTRVRFSQSRTTERDPVIIII